MKFAKKTTLICFIVAASILATLAIGYSTLLILTSESFYAILPYDKVDYWLLYDHIEYNGVDYYRFDPEDGVIPDFSKEISIRIVNSKCEPYDENRFETAYLCQNDDNNVYIYYISCYYVSEKALSTCDK